MRFTILMSTATMRICCILVLFTAFIPTCSHDLATGLVVLGSGLVSNKARDTFRLKAQDLTTHSAD